MHELSSSNSVPGVVVLYRIQISIDVFRLPLSCATGTGTVYSQLLSVRPSTVCHARKNRHQHTRPFLVVLEATTKSSGCHHRTMFVLCCSHLPTSSSLPLLPHPSITSRLHTFNLSVVIDSFSLPFLLPSLIVPICKCSQQHAVQAS